jgi:VTC domain-containing protein
MIRFEKKYVLNVQRVSDLRRSLMASKSFRVDHESQTVNNLYFDSPGLAAVEENILGISNRLKYRIRWYGNTNININARFEIKRRKDIGNWKEGNYSLILKNSPWDLEINEFPDLSSFEQLDDIVLANMKFMKPSLLNRYYREYYINRNGDRLTIDRDIRYRNCRNGIIKNDPNVVVELKYSAKKENNGLIDFFNMTLSKNSKYVNGILSTTHTVFD